MAKAVKKETLEKYDEDKVWMLGCEPNDYTDYVDSVREWLREEVDQEYYTPDMPVLNKFYEHDIFVYGATKKNMTRAFILGKEPTPIGVGFTVSDQFLMYREDCANPDAVALPCGDPKTRGALYGEIYRVPTAAVLSMDFHYNNEGLYKRIKQTIRVKRGDNFMLHTCWIYVGLRSFWGKRIDNPTTERKLIPCDPLGVTIGNRAVMYYNFQHKYLKKQ